MAVRQLIGFAVLVLAPSLTAQTSVKARPCAAADSALGKKSAAWKGAVWGGIDTAGAVHFMAAPTGTPPLVTASARTDGATWIGVPPVQLAIFLRAGKADVLEGLDRDPNVRLVVDDSISLQPEMIQLGTFIGPKRFTTVPVSALFDPTSFLKLARAHSAYVMVEKVRVVPTKRELQNIKALYAVLACGKFD